MHASCIKATRNQICSYRHWTHSIWGLVMNTKILWTHWVSAIINILFHSGKFCFDNKPPIFLSRFFSCSVSVLQDALLWYTYDAVITISTTFIAKRKVDYDDRGAFNMFQELMHSWVGYKLVRVLLAFGLSPKIWDDLESWLPDLFNLFSYLGDKQWDP